MKTYLVGGAVRDMLLGLDPKDKDYVVVGATPEQMLALGFSQVGASFPVFLHPVTGEEYALARTERKTGVGYNGFDVTFDPSITLEDDLIRRDLTINAMAMDEDGTVIDPFGGQRDLKHGRLRHTSVAFAEDPVRVLRTARFAARYGFDIDPSTVKLMDEVVDELEHVPAERIFAEFEKGLSEDQAMLMFATLEECNAFRVDALRPWSTMRSVLLERAAGCSTDVKFALIADGFGADDFAKCKVPLTYSSIAKAFEKNLASLVSYQRAWDDQRLALFESLRAFSQRELLERCVEVATVYIDATGGTYSKTNRDLIFSDLERMQKVDTVAIASQFKDGKQIAAAIRQARYEALIAR